MFMSLVVLFISLVLPIVVGQTTHVVTVGVEGSFFSPETVSAGLGDTVTFVFGGDFHSVTQASFEAPCIPLAGGFNSGFQGRGPDFSDPTPFWNLVVTNISEPIWYFCEASVPSSHCETGMVGVINPPSIEMYNEYVSAARAVTSTPKPTPSFVGSGIGAIASVSPQLSAAPLSSVLSQFSFTPTSTSTSSMDPTNTVPAPSASSHTIINTGIIAGAATAGGLVLLACIASAYYFGRARSRRGRRHAPARAEENVYSHDKRDPAIETYNTTSSSAIPIIMHASPSVAASSPSTAALYDDGTNTEASRSPALSDAGGRRPLPRAPSASVRRYRPTAIHEEVPDMPGPGPMPIAPQVDMNALVKEVVSVLRHAPSPPDGWRNPNPNEDGDPAHGHRPERSPSYSNGASRWYEVPEGEEDGRQSVAPPYI